MITKDEVIVQKRLPREGMGWDGMGYGGYRPSSKWEGKVVLTHLSLDAT